MVVTATFLVMWMVCGLGAIAFASVAAASITRLSLLVVGAVVASAATWWWGPLDAPVAGVLAAGAAGLYLFRPLYGAVSIAGGGVLAGTWPWLMPLDGWLIALPVAAAAAVMTAAAWLSRTRPVFAPSLLQDDALLILLAGGICLAVLPGILDGWQSAVTLNVAASPAGGAELPSWLVAVVAGSLALGGVHSVWSRR